MSSYSNIIDKLAEYAQVLPSFIDERGDLIPTSEESKIRMLEANGFKVSSEEEANKTLKDFEKKMWQTISADVVCVKENKLPATFELRLPEGVKEVSYVIKYEDGKEEKGKVSVDGLKAIETATIEGVNYAKYEVSIKCEATLGYHFVEFSAGSSKSGTYFYIVPQSCYLPEGADASNPDNAWKIWGMCLQLYSLRSKNNWGIGDFSDLKDAVVEYARLGAGIIGLNPLTMLFPEDPFEYSPYRGSDREFINHIYIDVTAIEEYKTSKVVAEFVKTPEFVADLEKVQKAEKVDYITVSKLKNKVLHMLYKEFIKANLSADFAKSTTKRGQEYLDYCAYRGERIETLGLFQALGQHFKDQGFYSSWFCWPEEYKNPNSAEVKAFHEANAEKIGFYKFLQWVADEQLVAAKDAATAKGVLLYMDQAVGNAHDGMPVWADRDVHSIEFSIGAPPDVLGPRGQSWGFAPLKPLKVRERGYKEFITLTQALMRYGSALRMDHAMYLQRLFWSEINGPIDQPIRGSYVVMNREVLGGILALESVRNNSIVIAEDLGTVPAGFREWEKEMNIISSQVWYRHYADKNSYPYCSASMICSHDFPPLAAYWKGTDIKISEERGRYLNDAQRDEIVEARKMERDGLSKLIEGKDVNFDASALTEAEKNGLALPNNLALAAINFLASSGSCMVVLNPTDLIDCEEMINLPGTTNDVQPNWRYRLPCSIAEMSQDAKLKPIFEVLSKKRGLKK